MKANLNPISIQNAVAYLENAVTSGHSDVCMNIEDIGKVLFNFNYEDYDPGVEVVVDDSDDEDVVMLVTIANATNQSLITHFKCIQAVYTALFVKIRMDNVNVLTSGEIIDIDEELVDIAIFNHRFYIDGITSKYVCEDYEALKKDYLKERFNFITRYDACVNFLVGEFFGRRLNAANNRWNILMEKYPTGESEHGYDHVLRVLKTECIK